MLKAIEKMQHHYIVCGAGKTGIHIIDELESTKLDYVVIEKDIEHANRLRKKYPKSVVIEGDASSDDNLKFAGIEKSAGLITALETDKDNMFVVISAHQLNPNLRIITKNVELDARAKLMVAGATGVISPNMIGGMRMVSEMIRPAVVGFLDLMLRDKEKNLRVEEVVVSKKFAGVGKPLKESNIRKETGLVVIAIKNSESEKFIYNPTGEIIVAINAVLVVIGEVENINKLRALVAD